MRSRPRPASTPRPGASQRDVWFARCAVAPLTRKRMGASTGRGCRRGLQNALLLVLFQPRRSAHQPHLVGSLEDISVGEPSGAPSFDNLFRHRAKPKQGECATLVAKLVFLVYDPGERVGRRLFVHFICSCCGLCFGSFTGSREDRSSGKSGLPWGQGMLRFHPDLHFGCSWQCPLMTVPSRLCALSVPSTRLMKPCQTAVGSNRFCQMLPSVSAVSKNKCISVTWTAKLLPNVQECIVPSSRLTVTCSPFM